MVQILNNYERAIALLASQFRGEKENGDLTNLQKVIRALMEPFQIISDVTWQLKTELSLSTSIGIQLDNLGEILGISRFPGESDDDYRERLIFQTFINSSQGTPEDQINAIKFLTKATDIGYHEIYQADFQLETNGLTFPNPPNLLCSAIHQVSPAGVNYPPIVATYNVPISFEVSGDLLSEPLFVAPNPDDYSELHNLEMQPYNSILYVTSGNVESNIGNGGLDELNYPLASAGQLSELIQINGNLPPRR